MANSIRFPARLAFSNAVFEAKSFQGEGKADFNCAFLIDPSTPEGAAAIKQIEAEELAVAKAKWGSKADAVLTSLRANGRMALKDGDTKAEYDGYPGMKFINARADVRPLVIDRDRSPLTAADGRIYSGCNVIGMIELWAQDNSYGKRLNAQLKGIQFKSDNDAFGGGGAPASPDGFEDLSVDGDEESLV